MVITANDGGTYKDFEVIASDINLTANGDQVRFKDSAGATRVQFDLNSANATLTAVDGHSADLILDSTATTGGKSWNIRSGNTTGKLHLINSTDSVQVDVDTDGSVYSPAYMGVQVVSAAPTTSAPPSGAFVAYASGGTYRWYVHFGGGTWKSATLS